MSAARTYCRSRMDSLGYKEWTDGFNFENIPSSLQNRAYHLELEEATDSQLNIDNLITTVPVRVRVQMAGFRDPKTKIDQAAVLSNSIVAEFMSPENRLTQTTSDGEKVLNVMFKSKVIEPLGTSNDNTMRLNMLFDFMVIRSLRGD